MEMKNLPEKPYLKLLKEMTISNEQPKVKIPIKHPGVLDLDQLNEDDLLKEEKEEEELLSEFLIIGSLVLGAIVTYKRFMAAAAKACGGKGGGKAKSLCMSKYKFKAAQGALTAAKKNMAACSKTNNPEACKAKMGKQVAKWTGRAANAKSKVTAGGKFLG